MKVVLSVEDLTGGLKKKITDGMKKTLSVLNVKTVLKTLSEVNVFLKTQLLLNQVLGIVKKTLKTMTTLMSMVVKCAET